MAAHPDYKPPDKKKKAASKGKKKPPVADRVRRAKVQLWYGHLEEPVDDPVLKQLSEDAESAMQAD